MLRSRHSGLLVAARFVVLYTVLIVPWSWLGEVYSLTFSVVSTLALETVVDEREFKLRFDPAPTAGSDPAQRAWAVQFTGTEVRTGHTKTMPIEARQIGYVPFAVLLSVVLAAELESRRRRAILVGGLLLLGGRMALAIGLPIAHFVGTVAQGSVADTASQVVFRALIEPPDMMYATPGLAFLFCLYATRQPPGTNKPGGPSRPSARSWAPGPGDAHCVRGERTSPATSPRHTLARAGCRD